MMGVIPSYSWTKRNGDRFVDLYGLEDYWTHKCYTEEPTSNVHNWRVIFTIINFFFKLVLI